MPSGFAAAQGDWTAEGLIDFEGSLEFDTSASSGILQILSDNPSGLYENQLEFSFPVRFVKGMVREHIEANVGEINPIDPVLGGSWYVLEISFTADSSVLVTAEDGHIQSRFSADYVIDESGVVSLENILSVP